MATKMTKRDYFEAILALSEVQSNPAYAAFIERQLELLAHKRASGEAKPTKTQIANEGIKEVILANMEAGERYQIKEYIKSVPALAEFTVQKISALMRQLASDGKVTRSEEKGVTYFSLAQ